MDWIETGEIRVEFLDRILEKSSPEIHLHLLTIPSWFWSDINLDSLELPFELLDFVIIDPDQLVSLGSTLTMQNSIPSYIKWEQALKILESDIGELNALRLIIVNIDPSDTDDCLAYFELQEERDSIINLALNYLVMQTFVMGNIKSKGISLFNMERLERLSFVLYCIDIFRDRMHQYLVDSTLKQKLMDLIEWEDPLTIYLRNEIQSMDTE